MNYIKRTETMDVYIEPNRNTIVIRQRWKYNWLTKGQVSPWNYVEKRDWHHKADTLVWKTWGKGYIALAVSLDNTHTNKSFHRKEFKVEFDIEWVLNNEQWLANVTKAPAGTKYRSNVDTTNRIVNVLSSDVQRTQIDPSLPDVKFNVFNHEYGHTFYFKDDYGKRYGNTIDGPYSDDIRGIMTIGEELRTRYVRDIKSILNDMVPQVSFSLLLK